MTATQAAVRLLELSPLQLVRGRFQPRQHFDEEKLLELAETIKTTQGLLQPIVVRPLGDKGEGQYEIIAGERRWRAAMIAKLETVSCLVRHFSDEAALEASVIENVSRADLNPIEEAEAYQRLMLEFGYIHEEVAAALGKSRTKITNSLRLLKLDPRIQAWLTEGLLTEGHGKILAGLSLGLQWALAQRIVKNSWSVQKTAQAAKQLITQPEAATEDCNLVALERALSDHIGCHVKIDYENTRGKLEIQFHDLEILQGLFKKMGFEYT